MCLCIALHACALTLNLSSFLLFSIQYSATVQTLLTKTGAEVKSGFLPLLIQIHWILTSSLKVLVRIITCYEIPMNGVKDDASAVCIEHEVKSIGSFFLTAYLNQKKKQLHV